MCENENESREKQIWPRGSVNADWMMNKMEVRCAGSTSEDVAMLAMSLAPAVDAAAKSGCQSEAG